MDEFVTITLVYEKIRQYLSIYTDMFECIYFCIVKYLAVCIKKGSERSLFMRKVYMPVAILAVLLSVSVVVTFGTVYAQEGHADVMLYNDTVNSADGVKVDETTFPDANFRQWVSDNFDEDKDGALSQDEIDLATDINVSGQNIADLTGIEYFAALFFLDCSNNQLTSLCLKNHPELYDLDCGNNRLTVLDVSGATALENLKCANNQLTVLDFSGNPALAALHCSSNQLTNINLKGNTNLEVVNSSSNKLTSLDLSASTKLDKVFAQSNQLLFVNLPQGANLTDFTVTEQTTSTITTADGTYDLLQLMPDVDAKKLKVTSGASLSGTKLSGLQAGTPVAMTYDCGASQTMSITLNVTVLPKNQNSWTTPLSIQGWTYGQAANVPVAQAQYGEVVFTYSNAPDGVFTADMPTEPGVWYVKAAVAAGADYEALEEVAAFTILSALSTESQTDLDNTLVNQISSLSNTPTEHNANTGDTTVVLRSAVFVGFAAATAVGGWIVIKNRKGKVE